VKTREHILDLLAAARPELKSRFGVDQIALFGSTVRGDRSDASDVDVLVTVGKPISLFGLGALSEYLEEVLGVARVDVVLRDSILPALRESILREAIDVR
jgi:predicted nucleotidyltransferase